MLELCIYESFVFSDVPIIIRMFYKEVCSCLCNLLNIVVLCKGLLISPGSMNENALRLSHRPTRTIQLRIKCFK